MCDLALAPTNETFDNGFSQCWAQETNDDFDWTVDAGGTPSGGTGPIDDFTGGGNYLYTEASSPRASGDVATVYSEIIDISGLTNPGLKFLNHMYGSAIGTLTVDLWDASTGTNLGTVFTHSGDRGNQWNEELIAFSSTTATIIQFSITATLDSNDAGQSWPGDIAIDEFGVRESPANNLALIAAAVSSDCDLTSSEPLELWVYNNGLLAQSSFDLSYYINGGTPVVESITSTVNPGDTLKYVFSTSADLSLDGIYNIDFNVNLTTDSDLSDNIFTATAENFITPPAPTTIGDTICNGDTAILYSDADYTFWYDAASGGNLVGEGNELEVDPSSITSYFAEAASIEGFQDNFESYNSGDYIAASNPNNWATWSGSSFGDAQVLSSQSSSGSNSLYLNNNNGSDLILPFGDAFSSGKFYYSMDMYIVSSGYFNFQENVVIGTAWNMSMTFNGGVINIDVDGTNVLTGAYSTNSTGGPAWFNLELECDYSTGTWEVFVDGNSQGVFVNSDPVAAVNFYASTGNEFYIDNVEWSSLKDDACRSITRTEAFINTSSPNCPTCVTPSNLTTNYISEDSAQIIWSSFGNETAWNTEYGPAGFTQGSGIISALTVANTSFSNLNPNTSYDFYVQSYCGNGDFSNWYGPYTFQTLTPPSCYYTIQMQDSYGDGWNGASIDVSANGSIIANWGFSNGIVALDSVETFNGDVIDFSFNSGSWDSEITFQITSPDGNISSWGPSPPVGVFLTDTSVAPCQPTTVNVTFQVDMNLVTSTFSVPEVNGTWNSWCGNCNPMTDTDGDGIWEATIPLLSGNYEYKYSADTWTIQEMNDPNASCTNGDPIYTNRTLTVGTSDITIPLVCWGSCSPCLYPPQAPQGITCSSSSPGIIFSDDIDNNSLWNGDIGSGNGYWRTNSGGTSSSSTGPLSSHSGNEYLYFETSTGGLDTATIVSSPINLSSGSLEAELTFWMHAFGSNIGTLRVGASSNPNGPFTDFYSWTGQYQANQSDPWIQVGVDLAAYIGQTMYLSFTYERANVGVSYQGDLAIDLIEVTTCQSCVDPSGLAINSITNNSAQITWSNDASINTWNTEFGPVGFNLGNGNVSAVSTNSIDFNNLNVNTSYDFYVQAYCGNGNFSSWVGPFTFQTLSDPGCYYKIAMQDSYGDGWNGASIDVSLNGNIVKNLTCSGFNSIDSVLTYSGSIVDFNFNSGSWDSEITFQITNSQGLQIGSFGPSPATGLFLSDTSLSICPSSYAVTLELNASTIYANGGVIGPNGMYAGGGFLGDAMAVPMIQSTVDTNIWTAVVNVPAGPGPFHYTFLNSPSNGGDWGTKEDLSGLICGDPSNYNDRLLPTITSDTTIQHCFGNCATDGTCIPPVLPANAVTLTLNTSNITNYGTSIGPNGMYVGGGFLGDALAVPMIQSQANPNLWTATVNVVPGSGPNYYTFLK